MIQNVFPGLVMYCADAAQRLPTADEELDDLDHDRSVMGNLFGPNI